MYDYDRTNVAWDLGAHEYERVVTAFTREIADKTFKMVSTILELADEAVHNLTFNAEITVHDEIKKAQSNLASVSRWMTSRKEVEAEPVARFADLASDLVEVTKFWSRPIFLNKGDYLDKVVAIVKKLYALRKEVVTAFRRSGVWKATPGPAH